MTSTFDRFIDALRDAGKNPVIKGNRARCHCPAHEDDRPSLSVGPRKDGKGILIYCHAGCDNPAIVAALNLSMSDLYDDKPMRDAYADQNVYTYSDGRKVHRRPGKKFHQEGNTKGTTLFRADRVTAGTRTVYVVEGKKDVLCAEAVGATAVCSPMGAGKASKFDWTPLRGKQVVVVADKDEPGRRHARDIAGLLRDTAESVHIRESAVGKDLADHVAAGKTLDELVDVDAEPEPGPIDGAALLDELRSVLTRYVAFPDEHAPNAVALWIAATHALPAFECAPRLVVTSPEKRCGKTRLLDIVGGTCHKPLATSNATVAAIFRSISGDRPPTIVIDEADTIFGNKKVAEQNEDLRALLNAGHQRGRPALRCVGPNQTPTEFSTFAMAALAGIGRMPDTITDRGINLAMRRRASGEQVSQFRSRRDGPKLTVLRDKLAAWADTQIDALKTADPAMPVQDRFADTWEPLVAIADAAGGHWPRTARQACAALVAGATETDEDDSLAVKLLVDIKRIFADKQLPFLASAELVESLRKVDESPWADFDLNARKLANRLRNFGIKPGRAERNTVRGYTLESLTDAFSRYTRPHPSDPSTTGADQGQREDTSESVDTSIRPHENIRPHETAGQEPLRTGWTYEDGPPAGNGSLRAETVTAATAEQHAAYRDGVCVDCQVSKPSAGRPRCDDCHRVHVKVTAGYDR